MVLHMRGGITEIGNEPAGCPPSSIAVPVGGLTQAVLSAGGPNATFCLEPGTYRQTSVLTPLAGQRIVSRLPRQAVISGATLQPAANWTFSGGRWVLSGQTQGGSVYSDVDGSGNELGNPEQVFYDDEPLLQVSSLGALSSGEFYFDYAANTITIADNPSGHIVEVGQGIEHAFEPTNSNVTLEGLVVEKFNTFARRAAVRIGTGWDIIDVESRLNYGAGFTLLGNNGLIQDSRSHDNRFAGIFANDVSDCTLTRLEVDHNAWGSFNTNWESSGSKFVFTLRLTATDCHFHDNRGAGFWTDIDNVDTTITGGTYSSNGNVSSMHGMTTGNNSGFGIVAEIGYDFVVNGVTAEHNNGPGIIASNNRAMEVKNSISRDNGAVVGSGPGNIYAWSQPRGNSNATSSGNAASQVIAARYGNNPERASRSFFAHDNTVGTPRAGTPTLVCGIESLGADPNATIVFQSGFNNRWVANHYEFAVTLARYEWQDVALTGTQWKTAGTTWLPFDTAGTWT